MRLAVSGAGGFLGRHLVRHARAEGHSVLPLVRVRRPGEGADVWTMDEFFANGGREPLDAFVHAAAIRHRYGSSRDDYTAANVDLVLQVALSLRGKGTRLVFVSSVGVYGFPKDFPISERHPYAPRTTYSETKVLAERGLRTLAKETGLEVTIVRPCIIYGPGDQNGMLDKMARLIKARRYALVGSGKNTLHHVFVDDVVRGLLQAARLPAAAHDDFILAGPETTTLEALSLHVARAVQVPLTGARVPLGVARALASMIDGLAKHGLAYTEREPPVNHEKLDVMTLPTAFDIEKARRMLGYAPRVGYAEGVPRALRGEPL